MDALPTGSPRITVAHSGDASSGLQPVSPLRPVVRSGDQNPQLSAEQNVRTAEQPAAELALSENALQQVQSDGQSAVHPAKPLSGEVAEMEAKLGAPAARIGSADENLERVARDGGQSGRAAYVELGGEARQLAQAAQRQIDVGRIVAQESRGAASDGESREAEGRAVVAGTVTDDFGTTRDAGTTQP